MCDVLWIVIFIDKAIVWVCIFINLLQEHGFCKLNN